MKALEWLATASQHKLILARPGADTVTITRQRRGWAVHTAGKVTTMDAVQLEDWLEAWDFRGYREVTR